jgi:hypothetical protein
MLRSSLRHGHPSVLKLAITSSPSRHHSITIAKHNLAHTTRSFKLQAHAKITSTESPNTQALKLSATPLLNQPSIYSISNPINPHNSSLTTTIMSFLRATSLRQFQAVGAPAFRTQRAAFSITTRSLATSDYGSGKGDPRGEKPQEQGANPSADLEHPGPPPPKEGQGSGAGPTKGGVDSSNSGNASEQSKKGKQQPQQQQQDQQKSSAQKSGAPQPKIHNPSGPPSKESESEEVREHNRQMDQRTETASNQASNEDAKQDQVPKEFWRGE